MDYTSGPYTVTFPAGQTNATFDVPTNDDNILKDNKNFLLTISPSSLPSDVTVVDPDEATVTIVDDDGKKITINLFKPGAHSPQASMKGHLGCTCPHYKCKELARGYAI